MPRLFTALEIPAMAAMSLSMLRGGLPGARWIDPENYHITLRFIGDIDGRTADEVMEQLTRIRRAAVEVRIRGLDAFGGGKPHSVFAAVERNSALLDLQAEHERAMQRIGLKAEGRRFVPHVTLARLKSARDGDIANWLSLRGSFSLPPFQATHFVLFSSRDSVGGGPYVAEERFALSAPRKDAIMPAALSPGAQ
jgi:2'-5' RNA ligase